MLPVVGVIACVTFDAWQRVWYGVALTTLIGLATTAPDCGPTSSSGSSNPSIAPTRVAAVTQAAPAWDCRSSTPWSSRTVDT